jgi:hypothetical protein
LVQPAVRVQPTTSVAPWAAGDHASEQEEALSLNLLLPVGGLLVFAFLAGAALCSLWSCRYLPEHYRGPETTSTLRLGTGVIATLTAVVLGLLISGVKGHLDLENRDLQAYGARLILLDRTLRRYGPNAAHARDSLADYTQHVLEVTFPSNGQIPIIADPAAEERLNETEQAILSLQPDPNDYKGQALTQLRDILQRRQTIIEMAASTVSMPIVLILTMWMGLIFASFGYGAPRNRMTVVILVVAAAAVASAIFLILEIDRPLEGVIRVSNAPMRDALSYMRR